MRPFTVLARVSPGESIPQGRILPLVFSWDVSPAGLTVLTVIWLIYKPYVSKGRERMGWLSVSVMIRAFNEKEIVEGAIRDIVLPIIKDGETAAVASFVLLWWIVPYSAVTVRSQSWLTR